MCLCVTLYLYCVIVSRYVYIGVSQVGLSALRYVDNVVQRCLRVPVSRRMIVDEEEEIYCRVEFV